MTSKHWFGAAAACVLLLELLPQAKAVPTQAEDLASFEEFDKGKVQGTLVSSEGEVLAGLQSTRLKGVSVSLLWSRLRTSDGEVFFGTGEEARILSVRGDKVREVAKLKGILVTALAEGPKGKLLAASMPGPLVVEVDRRTGKWRELAKVPAKHVWALHYDATRRTVVAATGAPGKLVSVPLSVGGKPKVLFDPKEKHLLCLTEDGHGGYLTGGSDKAVLYRVTRAGKARAIHDFDASELHSVAVSGTGAIYVAVNEFPAKTSGVPRVDRPKPGKGGTTFKAKAGKKAAFRPQELRPGAKSGKGAVFGIDPSGRLDELLKIGDGYFTDVAVAADGTLWAADAGKGKVYRIDPKHRSVATLFDVKERQVLSLALGIAGENGDAYFGTGDSGAIYRVSLKPAAKPAYETKVIDGKFLSRWGNVRVQSTAPLSLFSRSGNTSKPDETWGAWVPTKRTADESLVAVHSSAARYLQLRAVWPSPAKGSLRSLRVYFRPQNQRALVTEVKLQPVSPGKGQAAKGTKRKITWKVENPDKDPLVYRVFFRDELGVGWLPIDDGKPLEKTEYEWDTEGIADGLYRIKVVASDQKANGPETALEDSRLSPPVLVDNRPPDVVGLTVRYPWASGLARDSYGPIALIEYAVNGGEWTVIDCVDQVYDSSAEAFRLLLPKPTDVGAHMLAVRVRDAGGNVAVRQVRYVPTGIK